MPVKQNQPQLRQQLAALFERAEQRAQQQALRRRQAQDPFPGPQRLTAWADAAGGDATRTLQLATAHSAELAHGRYERRQLSVLSIVAQQEQWASWSGCRQVWRVERDTLIKKTGKRRLEVVYGITSLSAEQAGAAQLLQLLRGHWSIENRSHWVRDVTYDEDRSTVRRGNVPQVMAALRNSAIGLLRLGGATNIAAACRHHAMHPAKTLTLLHATFK